MKKKTETPESLEINRKIKFFKGRPEREKIINEEDMVNLKITLETSKDVLEFISLI